MKGFESPARLEFSAVVILTCWYLLIFLSFTVGEKLGGLLSLGRRSSETERLLSLNSNLFYYIFSCLTAVGLAATFVTIFRTLSPLQAIVFITLGQANSLKDALYEDYSIGFVSLRYLVLFSASIALYRIIRWRSFGLLNILNVLMLGASALLLGSRLTLIATLLTVVFLLSFDKPSIRFSVRKLTFFVTLLFLILSALNFSRNFGYYERNNLSFGLAGVSEILSYLGSPFQVAIGSAPVVDQLVAGGGETYRNYVDEAVNLNTNSAFVHLHEQMGFGSWGYIAVICLFMGFVFRCLVSRGKTIFLLPAGAVLYGSAELWRLDLFHQGIFIVWFVMGIGLPALLICSRSLLTLLGGDVAGSA